jgi:hypothetical protein
MYSCVSHDKIGVCNYRIKIKKKKGEKEKRERETRRPLYKKD